MQHFFCHSSLRGHWWMSCQLGLRSKHSLIEMKESLHQLTQRNKWLLMIMNLGIKNNFERKFKEPEPFLPKNTTKKPGSLKYDCSFLKDFTLLRILKPKKIHHTPTKQGYFLKPSGNKVNSLFSLSFATLLDSISFLSKLFHPSHSINLEYFNLLGGYIPIDELFWENLPHFWLFNIYQRVK